MLGGTQTCMHCLCAPACLPARTSFFPLPCSKEEYEFTDPDTNRTYYVDPLTKETSWDKPDELWWVEVQTEDGERCVVCGAWEGCYGWGAGGREGRRAGGQLPVVCWLRWIQVQAEGGEQTSSRVE
jgi:hypothetical protein